MFVARSAKIESGFFKQAAILHATQISIHIYFMFKTCARRLYFLNAYEKKN